MVGLTHEEMESATWDSLQNMGDELAPVAASCDVVAVASGAAIAAPAVVSFLGTPAGFQTMQQAGNIGGAIEGIMVPGPYALLETGLNYGGAAAVTVVETWKYFTEE